MRRAMIFLSIILSACGHDGMKDQVACDRRLVEQDAQHAAIQYLQAEEIRKRIDSKDYSGAASLAASISASRRDLLRDLVKAGSVGDENNVYEKIIADGHKAQ